MKEILSYVIEHKILQKITLSKPSDDHILRTIGRLTELRGGLYLSLETFYSDGKTSQKNIAANENLGWMLEDKKT